MLLLVFMLRNLAGVMIACFVLSYTKYALFGYLLDTFAIKCKITSNVVLMPNPVIRTWLSFLTFRTR